MKRKKFTQYRKTAVAALCALAVTCTGLAAACAHPVTTPDEEKTTQREDTQLLKNGNFEYWGTIPEDGVYLIKNVSNWSRSGDSSGVMSGIINTSEKAWKKLTDEGLKAKLEYNEDLSSSSPDYESEHVDYNGMKWTDIPYSDSYAASLDESNIGDDDDGLAKDSVVRGGGSGQRSYSQFLGVTEKANQEGFTYGDEDVYFNEDDNDYYFDSEYTKSVRYATIANPGTHYGEYSESEGKHYLGTQEILIDDDGNYWKDSDGDGKIDVLKDESMGNVLMIHNYPGGKLYNGIEQHYTSQTTITLEANTAAEISVWVKTAGLKFDKGYSQLGDQDRGAYIGVTQSIGSASVDSFKIKAINTEKIIADNADLGANNGWLKYTVYVNACDFSQSTITINLGLGDEDTSEKVTGYAFFDDVEVKKFIDLKDEGCSYSSADVQGIITSKNSSCSLTSEGDDKIFIADKQIRGVQDARYSDCFYYLVDLAAETYGGSATSKVSVPFSSNNLKTTAALTTEEARGKTYALSTGNGANISGFTANDSGEAYTLPSALKNVARPTYNDLVTILQNSVTSLTADMFAKTASANDPPKKDVTATVNKGLFGENSDMGPGALEDFSTPSDMMLIVSVYGAAYTATVENSTPVDGITPTTTNLLGVNGKGGDNNYKLISFWIKTMDMDGKTATTVKLVDVENEDNTASFTIDTSGQQTDVGDNKNIYSDWVQCFFFVENDTETAKDFKLEFSFGATTITTATQTACNPGWAAIANMQTLEVNEDVYKLVSEGTYAKKLTISKEEPEEDQVFDSANVMSDIDSGIALPAEYKGVSGGSSYVTDKPFAEDYDKQNNFKDAVTGLVNRDSFDSYDNELKQAISEAFTSSTSSSWDEIFGKDSYQPLIIIDKTRTYRDRLSLTADDFDPANNDYYTKDGAGDTYTKVDGAAEFDENATYYSAEYQLRNYGYLGSSKTVSADSYVTVSVKVKVAGGATAYIYLVNSDTDDVLTFKTPSVTFYYDVDGNVLDKEYDADWTDKERADAIVYSVRDDGLYEDKDGNIYANLHNLTKRYQYPDFEHNDFYTYDGVKVRYDELEDGVDYYSDNAHTKEAAHFLVVDEKKVYEYDADEGAYYYLVNGKRGVKVNNFDEKYARYEGTESAYKVAVTDTDGEWATVNFAIHTGDAEKNYRLELWSGEREKTGLEGSPAADGAIAFDYSYFSVSESNYSSVLGLYETTIKDVCRDLIITKEGNADKIKADMNVKDYLDLCKELEIEVTAALAAENLSDVAYAYYTFTLYDSAKFVPFNLETAEAGKTGYDFDISDESEALVYFFVRDGVYNSYNMFVDYASVDKTVSLADDSADTDSGDTGGSSSSSADSALLITSIILVVVLIFALLAILIRGLWKKYAPARARKDVQKNNYKKRERYIRRLGLTKNEEPEEEPASPDGEEPADSEAPAEEVPAEEPPVEETPAEEAPAAETPAEDGAPAEEPAAPAEDENKGE